MALFTWNGHLKWIDGPPYHCPLSSPCALSWILGFPLTFLLPQLCHNTCAFSLCWEMARSSAAVFLFCRDLSEMRMGKCYCVCHAPDFYDGGHLKRYFAPNLALMLTWEVAIPWWISFCSPYWALTDSKNERSYQHPLLLLLISLRSLQNRKTA